MNNIDSWRFLSANGQLTSLLEQLPAYRRSAAPTQGRTMAGLLLHPSQRIKTSDVSIASDDYAGSLLFHHCFYELNKSE